MRSSQDVAANTVIYILPSLFNDIYMYKHHLLPEFIIEQIIHLINYSLLVSFRMRKLDEAREREARMFARKAVNSKLML